MRAMLAHLAALGSLLLLLCLAWLSTDGSWGSGTQFFEKSVWFAVRYVRYSFGDNCQSIWKACFEKSLSRSLVVKGPFWGVHDRFDMSEGNDASCKLLPKDNFEPSKSHYSSPVKNMFSWLMMPNQTGIQKSEQASKCKEMWNNNWSSSIKKKRYSEDYYLQIIGKLQSCTWKKRPQEYAKFKSELASCCDAVHNFIASQNNTPLGSNMSYEVDKKTIHITEEIFSMLPESQPLEYPFKHCAVVGNGGILKNSSCGAEIDKSDFVFRCNLPPTIGNVSQDVGNKTNLVTINPSIILQKYNKLNEKKATFLENIASYGDAFLLLPAFSFMDNTAASFKVHRTLREFRAKQKAIFFYPRYLKNLAQYWRTKGVKAYRLSSGFMITSIAVELCENVRLYGFWPFSKNTDGTSISHHYYDNKLPKPGFHAMPIEYNQILQLHGRGILKLQLGKCLTD